MRFYTVINWPSQRHYHPSWCSLPTCTRPLPPPVLHRGEWIYEQPGVIKKTRSERLSPRCVHSRVLPLHSNTPLHSTLLHLARAWCNQLVCAYISRRPPPGSCCVPASSLAPLPHAHHFPTRGLPQSEGNCSRTYVRAITVKTIIRTT